MTRTMRLLCWMLLVAHETLAFSWTTTTTGRKDLYALGNTKTPNMTQRHASRKHLLTMRDRSSSYWFSVGDQVRVVEDVHRGSQNLRGRTGKVVETWEKCDVDPTCCCAEQVDTDMAVRVVFQDGNNASDDSDGFFYYFAEEELTKV